jgi:hypothetical protein
MKLPDLFGYWSKFCRFPGGNKHLRSGISLNSEALGLAVMTELPLVVIDVQREDLPPDYLLNRNNRT